MLQFRVGRLVRSLRFTRGALLATFCCLPFMGGCSAPLEDADRESGDEGEEEDESGGDGAGARSPDFTASDAGATGGAANVADAAMAADATTPTDVGRGPTASDARAGTPPTKPANMLYVAVGWGGRRTSSTDGVTWANEQAEARPGGDDNNLLRGVGYGAGLFVAVGGGPNIRMLVTRDGRTWTRPNHPSGQWLGGVAYGNGIWVAVGGLGRRMMSTDGMTWRDVGGSGSHLRSVAFANGRFVAAGSGLCTSTTDGQQWTRAVACGSNAERVAGGGGRWVVVPYAGRSFASSSDGQTWSTGSLPSDSRNGVAYAYDRFYVSASAGLLTSRDGMQWQTQASTGLSVLAFDGYDKLLGAQNGTLKVSGNGSTWTTGNPSGNSIMGIAAGPLSP